MIIAVIGDVGSTKSLTTIRNIKLNPKKIAFVNFETKGLPNCIRLKKSDIVEKYVDENSRKEKSKVNWDFWENAMEKFKEFDIYLDEIGLLFSHRTSLSSFSVEGLKWISQIRKILGKSETSNIFLVSQSISHLDVGFRRLLHAIIYVEKTIRPPKADGIKYVISTQYYFLSRKSFSALERFEAFRQGGVKSYNFKKRFVCNPYFNYYDSYKLVRDDEFL